MRLLLILIIIGTVMQVAYALKKERKFQNVKRRDAQRRAHLKSVQGSGSGAPILAPMKSPKGGSKLLTNLADPLQAAGILLVKVASFDGDISPAQKDRIITNMQQILGADPNAAQSHYSFGRMALGQVNDITANLPLIVKPIRKNCTIEEMRIFVNMMLDVAGAETDVSPEQENFIDDTQLSLLK